MSDEDKQFQMFFSEEDMKENAWACALRGFWWGVGATLTTLGSIALIGLFFDL